MRKTANNEKIAKPDALVKAIIITKTNAVINNAEMFDEKFRI